MSTVTLSTKGQIVLPKALRDQLNLHRGARMRVAVEADRIVLTPVTEEEQTSWSRWRGRLAGSDTLREHLSDHGQEVAGERLS